MYNETQCCSEMAPELAQMVKYSPFVPKRASEGYHKMLHRLENQLGEITGFPPSLQPNSGAQGEYSGLMVIRSIMSQK